MIPQERGRVPRAHHDVLPAGPDPSVNMLVCSSPAVANGVLYLATGSGVVYALNASTGKELWHSHIPSHVNQSSPVVANGRLYLGSGSKQVFAFAP